MINIHELDANYKAFPSFSEWENISIDLELWNRYFNKIKYLKKNSDAKHLEAAIKLVTNAAALDTGVIEGLYDVERGFTVSVASEVYFLQAIENSKGERVREFVKNHLDAYEIILDFATRKVNLIEVFIRNLHEIICASQNNYSAIDRDGKPVKKELPLGKYKSNPNHVVKEDNGYFAYCPVDLVPHEMQRFCKEVNSDKFASAHPLLQCAYAHYAFILIHPFQDGNGRVARALASIYTFRSSSLPLMILSDTRNGYIESLEKADDGKYKPFVDFLFDRYMDTICLVEDTLKRSKTANVNDILSEIDSLEFTKGGYEQLEVDSAARRVLPSVESKMILFCRKFKLGIQLSNKSTAKNNNNKYRVLEDSQFVFQICHKGIKRSIVLSVFVPNDYRKGEEFLLRSNIGLEFNSRFEEVFPSKTESFEKRVDIFVEILVSRVLEDVKKIRAAELKKKHEG